MMNPEDVGRSLVKILAAPAYIDDVAIMQRTRDPKAAPPPDQT